MAQTFNATTEAYRPQAPIVTGRGLAPAGKKTIVGIGRDLCSFSWLDQRGTQDRTARRREAELEAMRVAMSPQPGIFIHIGAQGAAVWTWDDGAVTTELERAERDDLVKAPRAPETTLLAPEIASNGARLLSLINGFEGQVWRDGELVGSRWWRERPTSAEWSIFAEAMNLAGGAPPGPLSGAALARPYKANDYRPATAEIVDPRLVFWGGAAVAAASLAAIAFAGGVEMRFGHLKTEIAALEAQAGPVRKMHTRVLSADAEYRRLTSPIQGQSGLRLVSAVADVLGPIGVKAISVEFRDKRVNIAVPKSATASADRMLQALENHPLFMTAKLGDGMGGIDQIVLTAELESGGP